MVYIFSSMMLLFFKARVLYAAYFQFRISALLERSVPKHGLLFATATVSLLLSLLSLLYRD